MSVALVAVLGLAACAGPRSAAPPPPPDVVALWTGATLTLSDFETVYRRTSGSPDPASDSLGAYQDFLERYVDFRLKVQQARGLGYGDDPELQAEVDGYRLQLARPAFLDQEILDEVVQQLYERQQEQVRARHILIAVDPGAPPADTLAAYERILALKDSIEAGGRPFEEIAMQYSQDPSVAQNGGDLGYFSGGRMVAPFEDAAYSTPVGSLSDPVRTQFGYHLLEVTDRRPKQGSLRARHILVRTGQTPEDRARARRIIETYQERLEAGESFEELARQYSEDPGSARQGGDLGYFESGRMVAPFDSAAFSLQEPGERSGIVETRFGFHLIELVDRRAAPTFEEAEPELRRTAEQLPRTRDRLREIAAAYRDAHGGTLRMGTLDAAFEQYPPDSLLVLGLADRFGVYADSAFATLGDSTFTLARLAQAFAGRSIPPGYPADVQRNGLVDRANQIVDDAAITASALALEDRDPEFRALMEQFRDGLILFAISEDSVWSVASQQPEALERYFEANRAAYQHPERARLVTFTSSGDSLLQHVTRALDAGQSPAAIVQEHGGGPVSLQLDTLLVPTPLDGSYAAAAGLQPGQRTEIVPLRSRRAVFVLSGLEPPRPMTLDEARALVTTDFQAWLEAEWVARLRDQYGVRTYPDRLQGAFESAPPASQ